ncbi:unnamed protein product [Spirodela intermedia]|uniref:Uncharacterized protein n=1 Tax=Spirodela intermedia TaxID=51605 RepID=A0A7I8JIK7_SPIIN|nr:unnamed protein product [Spirodela intermedia]CAA6669252.1 unnamed protein product [Spirodela intermedia]
MKRAKWTRCGPLLMPSMPSYGQPSQKKRNNSAEPFQLQGGQLANFLRQLK